MRQPRVSGSAWSPGVGATALHLARSRPRAPAVRRVGLRYGRRGWHDQAGRRLLPLRQRRMARSHPHPLRQALVLAALGHERHHRGPAPRPDGSGRGPRAASAGWTSKARWGRSTRPSWTRAGSRRWGPGRSRPSSAECGRRRSRQALAALMARANSDFEGTLFNIGIDVDLKDPKRYAVYLGQGGLGLPDRDYYLKPEFSAQKAKYEAYVARLLRWWRGPRPPRGPRTSSPSRPG